jgi:putative DNA primase/helicase
MGCCCGGVGMTEYTAAERKVLIEQYSGALERKEVAPEFALKKIHPETEDDPLTKKFNEYRKRFESGELSKEEMERYDGDWLTALKEKDRKSTLDFIDNEGRQLNRNEKAKMNNRPCTDMGNAERLVDQFNSEIRYCHNFKSWLVWNYSEGRWKKDTNGTINRICKDVTRRIIHEAGVFKFGTDEHKTLYNWARQCECRTHIEGMLTLSQNDKHVIVAPTELDQDDFLFNLRNGTFNLKTFELQPHDKKLNISKLADYEYDAHAKCPMFLKYLDRIFRGNKNKDKIISYLQRAVGYTLTGITIEQVLFLPHGVGSNGKSVFLETVRALMGEYSAVIQSRSLTTNRSDINNDIAALVGTRFVCCSENNSDSKLDEEIIKLLTGGEAITARFLHQEFFTYKPKFKLWWSFNHAPVVSDQTFSIWRRIKIIPFLEVIPPEEIDKNLAEKLTHELPGIFNWAIAGLKEYYKNGLQEPEDVTTAVTSYKDDQDILKDFIDLGYVITNNINDEMRAETIYINFREWWFNNEQEKPMSSTKFGRLMRERNVGKVRRKNGNYYTGIRIKNYSEMTSSV